MLELTGKRIIYWRAYGNIWRAVARPHWVSLATHARNGTRRALKRQHGQSRRPETTLREVERDTMRKLCHRASCSRSLLPQRCGDRMRSVQRIDGETKFRDANGLYKSSDFKAAAANYERSWRSIRTSSTSSYLTPAYFFLANAYENLFQWRRGATPTNDEYMTKAVEYYRRCGADADRR